MFSIFVMRLLSSCSLVRRSRPCRLAICASFLKLKASASTSENCSCRRFSSARSASLPVTCGVGSSGRLWKTLCWLAHRQVAQPHLCLLVSVVLGTHK